MNYCNVVFSVNGKYVVIFNKVIYEYKIGLYVFGLYILIVKGMVSGY